MAGASPTLARRTPSPRSAPARRESLRSQMEVEPLGREFPRQYARVRGALEAAGHKIGDRDTIIATHALVLGATLVTRNQTEFSRVTGLRVENWELE